MDTAVEMQRYDSAVHIYTQQGPDYTVKSQPQIITTMEQGCARPEMSHQEPSQSDSRSRLLSLPTELQLLIWEFAVISDEPLYVNGQCDSFFGGWNEDYYADVKLWKDGNKKPPLQPSLTQVCRSIRLEALPMFYKHNRFQSGYCYETDTDVTMKWLKIIGEENRKLLRHFYFFDANWRHDVNCPKDLKKVMRGPVCRDMGGVVENLHSVGACEHAVFFGRKYDGEELDGLQYLFGES